MTGIADCLIKEDAQAVSASGKKETATDAGLFAALLGGKVLLDEAKKMPLPCVTDEPNGLALETGAETEAVDSLLIRPLPSTKKPDKALSGLSDAEIFSIACLNVEPAELPEELPKKLLDPDAELQMTKMPPKEGQGVNETLFSKEAAAGGAAEPVVSAEPQRTVPSAVGAPPESKELSAGKTANAVPAAAGPANKPAVDTASVAPEVATAASAAGLIQTKDPVGKRTEVSSAGQTGAAVEFGAKIPAGTVPAGSSAQESVRLESAAKAGTPESVPITDAAFVRLLAESVEKPDAERRRSSRTSMDLVAGRQAAVPETGRTAQFSPAHAGAVAAQASDSRAADLQKLIDTFDRHMLSMVKQGEKTTRVTLDSREMGRLTVVCREETSGLKIEIQAQSAAVQAALQRHEPALRQLLQLHGSAVGKFDVTCGDGRGADPRRFSRERNIFGEALDGGIEPAYSVVSEVEPSVARASAHAVSIFA